MTEPNAADPSAIQPPAAAPPAATPSAPAATPQQDPNWLNARIAQAKKNGEADALKALGVSSFDEAKAAVAAAKAAEDAKKSAEVKATELKTQLETTSARAMALETAVKERAAVELASLSDAQKAAVQAVAGDDAAAQLRAIDKLKPTWSAAPVAQAPAQPAKPAPAANTAPTREAPGSAPPDGTNHVAVYENLKQSNPFAAAQYRQTNRAALAQAESKKP